MDYSCYCVLLDSIGIGFQVIDIISSHPDHEVIIGMNTLGKEDLLVEISRALRIKASF